MNHFSILGVLKKLKISSRRLYSKVEVPFELKKASKLRKICYRTISNIV